jgi:HEAT repeat protein
MKRRQQIECGVPVPYGVPTGELVRQAKAQPPARWAAFVALAYDPSAEAADALRDAARDDDPHVRRAAIEAIGARVPDAYDAPLIVGALVDPSNVVVRTACDVAASLRIREAHDRVVQLLKDADANTRQTAARTLRALWEPQDFATLFEVLRSDPSPRVRKEAAWTLRDHVARDTWKALFEIWCRDPLHRHRVWACEIAAEFGGRETADHLSVLRNDNDGLVRRAANKALSAIGAA